MTKRLKLFMSGEAGVGKTTAAIQFPNSYVIDCERGTENYSKLFAKSGSVAFQSVDCEEIINEIRALGSEKHEYKTVVIDPITTMEADLVAKAEKKFGQGDMRVWGERDKFMRRLCNLLLSLDMNVIVTAHSKVDYGANMTKLGTTFDGWKRWPYVFDLWIELLKAGPKRMGSVRKTRIEAFPDADTFEFSYAEIKKRWDASTLERPASLIQLATPEQIGELKRLLEVVKLEDDAVDKWLDKAGVQSIEDMPTETIEKCIKFVQGKLSKANAA